MLPQPEWLWEMNPVFGKVPVLLHDGHTIYESLVTCEYIEVSVMVELTTTLTARGERVFMMSGDRLTSP